MSSLFEKIAKRQLPAHIVWENDSCIAFLDIKPVNRGHTLVVPKVNWGDDLFELSENQFHNVLSASRQVGILIKEKLNCTRVILSVEGFEVPHVHVHLIPAYGTSTPDFSNRASADTAELQKIHSQLTN